ncbi:uncharacterized protein C8A04DRAFT_8824 [Dichotomopilus funicola]|uniref:pH-response regulator protein palC n=1 Tax=Dichotomopilus funicola TaxID=1934379 RepID=A0AAN6ZRT4_9PEZI|nr:hypothetical protein C8A04DRAFT_8824 [Dichotomopilus funicola]
MPYPFVLPTTSSFSFSSSFVSESHPSLPLQASTHRGVVRDTLKKHKRLPTASQGSSLSTVSSTLQTYIPYLLALEAGLSNTNNGHHNPPRPGEISATARTTPEIEWRPTLSNNLLPGREPPRIKVHSLSHELLFVLSTLASTHTLQSRVALQPLYQTTTAPVGTSQRQTAITTATRHLLDAASIYDYLTARSESIPDPNNPSPPPRCPCADISPPALRALRSLALAEATLLAVLKDDPYPAAVAQARNPHDTEWMYKSPDLPKVRAHLFARLCLAASEHAAQAAGALVSASSSIGVGGSSSGLGLGGLGGGTGSGKVGDGLLRYVEDLRRASRARACRFFGIDAELGGETGTGIAWLQAGLAELGVERKGDGSGGNKSRSGLKGLKKEWSERREDKKVEKGGGWGADGGRMEETRVLEMLEAKWMKQNDTMLTQPIPSTGPLLAQMPSGREIHSIKPYQPPVLAPEVLEAMRAPPDRSDEAEGGDYPSSDDEGLGAVNSAIPGAFPGRTLDNRAGTGTPGYY